MQNKKEILYHPIKKKIILITGQHQSGKSFLNKIVCSLEKSNISIIDYFLEDLFKFYKFNKINKKVFNSLINLYFNHYLINKNLGRYLNFRPLDEGSIFVADKKKISNIIKDLISEPSKKNLIKKIKKNNEIIVQLHNALHCIDLIFSSFKQVKVINVINNPIDQILSIYNKHKFFGDPNYGRAMLAAESKYLYNKKIFSEHAEGLENSFFKLNRLQKILHSKKRKDFLDKKNIKLIQKFNKKKFLKINYEDIFDKKKKILEKISKFIKKKITTKSTDIFKSKEYNLRKKEILNRHKKEKFLLKNLNNNDKKILKKIIKDYENL